VRYQPAAPNRRLSEQHAVRRRARGAATRLALVFALAALAGPLAAGAQPAKVFRLGLLSPAAAAAAADRAAVVSLLPGALRDLGYVEGQNLVIERRFADGRLDRLPGLARELVERRVDAIVAVGDGALAAKAATPTIPIVMVAGDRFAPNLVRPAGNVTGLVLVSGTTLAAKRLELIKEAVPQATRIALLTTNESGARTQVQEALQAASALGVKLVVVEARGGDYESAFAALAAARAGALFAVSSPILNRDRARIIDLAAKHRLPAIYQWREHAKEGGLMAYGSNITALARRVAAYVDRLFKGASPADLPIEQPTTFELVVNLRTAKALGLTIPGTILARADEVIQ
jgi:putative ABC transport system substrate-binding protein